MPARKRATKKTAPAVEKPPPGGISTDAGGRPRTDKGGRPLPRRESE